MLHRGHCRDTGVPELGMERAVSSVKTLLTRLIHASLINPAHIDFSHLAEVLEYRLKACLALAEAARLPPETPTFA